MNSKEVENMAQPEFESLGLKVVDGKPCIVTKAGLIVCQVAVKSIALENSTINPASPMDITIKATAIVHTDI